MSKTIKAYAIHTIYRKNEKGEDDIVNASTLGKPSVFSASAEEFEKLEKLSAVRRATNEEIAVAKDAAARSGNPIADDDAEDTGTKLVGGDGTSQLAKGGETPKGSAKPPASGAKGDPTAAPAKAGEKAKSSDADDLNV